MKKFALVVGVERYRDIHIAPLRCAGADAKALAARLRERCGFHHVTLLVDDGGDGAPDTHTLVSALDELAIEVQPEDLVLVFFSGHGVEVDGAGYLLTLDSIWAHPDACSLPLTRLRKAVGRMAARKRVLLLDACRNAPQAAKGDGGNPMSEAMSKDILAVGQFKSDPGVAMATFSACRPGQRAFEWLQKGHGVFSYFLFEGLDGGAWDGSRLELQRLASYTEKGVIDWCRRSPGMDGLQHPWFNMEGSPEPILLVDGPGRPIANAKRLTASPDPESAEDAELRASTASHIKKCLKRLESGQPATEPVEGLSVHFIDDWQLGAEKGWPDAQWLLGVCHEFGWGVARDDAQMVEWYRKSAEQGLSLAQQSLGDCLAKARGTTKSLGEAQRWYRLAATAGHPNAKSALEAIELETSDDNVWNEALLKDDPGSYAAYLESHPEGRHAQKAKELHAEGADWRAANAASNREKVWDGPTDLEKALEAYLRKWPNGSHSKIARANLDDIQDDRAWKMAVEANSLVAFRNYLKSHPMGGHASEANAAADKLQAEALAWEAACERPATASYKRFLSDYPDSAYASEARRFIRDYSSDELAWRSAVDRNTVAAFSEYLAKYPQGNQAAVAKERVKTLADAVKGMVDEQAQRAKPGRGGLRSAQVPARRQGLTKPLLKGEVEHLPPKVTVDAAGQSETETVRVSLPPKPQAPPKIVIPPIAPPTKAGEQELGKPARRLQDQTVPNVLHSKSGAALGATREPEEKQNRPGVVPPAGLISSDRETARLALLGSLSKKVDATPLPPEPQTYPMTDVPASPPTQTSLRVNAAEQISAEAQNKLGIRYASGQGVEQDYGEAVRWFTKAAEQGQAVAQYNLGLCYYNGQGVAQNYCEAVRWYTKAAEQGHAQAQSNLGLCYDNGQGVAQDYGTAIRWYTKAAEQGHAVAQSKLGICYYKGQGVPRDYGAAVRWYAKAAEKGHAKAQYCLGLCYENGHGVKKDGGEAAKWYRKAAELGHVEARSKLNALRGNQSENPPHHVPTLPIVLSPGPVYSTPTRIPEKQSPPHGSDLWPAHEPKVGGVAVFFGILVLICSTYPVRSGGLYWIILDGFLCSVFVLMAYGAGVDQKCASDRLLHRLGRTLALAGLFVYAWRVWTFFH